MLQALFRSNLRGFALFTALPALVALGCAVDHNGTSGPLNPGVVGTGDAATGTFSGAGGASTGSGSGSGSSSSSGSGEGGSGGSCSPDVAAPEVILPDTTDPEKGNFTLDEALLDLPEGPGPLRAILETDVGSVTCELRPDKAPNGVANFVGLARGQRPWKDPITKKWVKRRFYDGLLFHGVDTTRKLVFSGDPLADGLGGPGYTFMVETSDLMHVPGTLGYTEVGGVDGSQFYMAAAALPSEDGNDTVFGLCAPVSVISNILTTWKDPPSIKLKTVTITRCAP
jgi:peptidyl-prolyl cis-trans isomerase A (cyclophilin A)